MDHPGGRVVIGNSCLEFRRKVRTGVKDLGVSIIFVLGETGGGGSV